MPGDELDTIADQLAGERHRLIGVAEIVAHNEIDVLAEDAASGVEIRDRHPGAALVLLAVPRVIAGHRAGRGDQNVRPSGRPERAGKHDNR